MTVTEKLREGSSRCRLGKIAAYVVSTLAIVVYLSMSRSVVQDGVRIEAVAPHLGLSEEDLELHKALKLNLTEPVVIRDTVTGRERKLHGRFLHITDMHPDAFYKEGSSIEKVCHEGKPKNKKDRAPRFGYAMDGCDSPPDLVEYTLEWIKENLRDKIDFVIWTGDNVRHDNDRRIPRTEFQILDMNDILSGKIQKLFSNPDTEDPRDFDVPVVPSIGNNDVFPHNMFALGPTLQTREYHRIWNNLVPQEQQRTFDRSASFVTEVIPGKLAVVSINTLYFFKANPLVDNCNSKKQPGYQMLLWLGAVLEELRERGVKVWLSGHVPPIEKNYAEGCYDKFTLWTHEYRDIIVGGLYGHMNMDHFIPIDGEVSWRAIEASKDPLANRNELNQDSDDDLDVTDHAAAGREAHLMGAKPVGKEAYMEGVRERIYERVRQKVQKAKSLDSKDYDYEAKRKSSRSFEEVCEDYSIVTISGSVIPTFNPSLRIWEYNITDLQSNSPSWQHDSWDQFYTRLASIMEEEAAEAEDESEVEHGDGFELTKKKRPGKKPKEDKTIPRRKPKNLPLGPAYTPQLFSPTRFVQFYADLKQINKDYYSLLDSGKTPDEAASEAFRYEVEYTSEDAPYPMNELLVKDFLLLASDLASDKKNWAKFTKRAFMSTGYTD